MSENEAKPDRSKILMSDALKELLPSELSESASLIDLAENMVMVTIGTRTIEGEEPIVGSLASIMFAGEELELDVHITMEDAAKIVASAPLVSDRKLLDFTFISITMNKQEFTFKQDQAFKNAGVRIGSFDHRRRMCTLMMNLR